MSFRHARSPSRIARLADSTRLAVGALALLLAACGDAPAPTAAPVADAASATIRTAPFSSVAIRVQREAPAQVRSINESRLAAEVSARIVEIPVKVGQRVGRGDVLLRLDDGDLRLAHARAEAGLAQAKARTELAGKQLLRARELRTQGFVSPDALQQRETELSLALADEKAAEVALETARRQLSKTVLTAPFAGVVRERTGQVGETAVPGTPLITLVDALQVEVAAQVQSRDAASLAGAEVQFESPQGRFPLTLLRVSPIVTPETRHIEARFAWRKVGLPPGAEGRITWFDEQQYVPANLVVRRGAAYGVFVADAGVARFRALAGAEEGRPAPAPLPPETQIVTEGFATLQDGAALPGAAQ